MGDWGGDNDRDEEDPEVDASAENGRDEGGHHVVDASAKYGREENYSEVDPSVEDFCDKNNPDVDDYVCAKKGPPQRMISKILKSTRSSKRKVVGTGLQLHRQNQVNPTQSQV